MRPCLLALFLVHDSEIDIFVRKYKSFTPMSAASEAPFPLCTPQTPAIVAVSGGLDSLLALALLAGQGQVLAAVWGRFLPGQELDSHARRTLRELCSRFDLPLLEIDLVQPFDQLVQTTFVRHYLQGLTPNPCALCNPRIKFGLLFEQAAARLGRPDASLATGHYAAVRRHPKWGALLTRGLDTAKEQSYFLGLLPRHLLPRLRFPLAEICKQDARGMLEQLGVPLPDKKESQEICFIPDNDYRAFIQKQAKARGLDLPGPGPVRLPHGEKIGEHQGLWRYTQGQRRGLGIPWHHPLYVLGKDHADNALIVGRGQDRRAAGCVLGEVNCFVPLELWPDKVSARLRYRQTPRPVRVRQLEGKLLLEFENPEAESADGPPAPGQLGVCYSEDGFVLAGGVIERALPLEQGGLCG